MQRISQADLARELGCGEMTLHRIAKAMSCNGQPLSDLDAVMILVHSELAKLQRLDWSDCIRVVAELEYEIRYVTADPNRRCWLVFVENEHGSHRLTAHTVRHLESLLTAFPLSSVLAVHELVGRAAERLDELRATKTREAA
ncbi:hypothetical protein [Rhizobium mayense]|uniref:hypothetical protein n=1 Tax=Rhizobium mayense TaxID=1312184 RepID=UPI00398C3925